ncbi:MAG: fibronectin type III domain-containing protein [Clostridia bacterium]|nr:fibronectin type III domain-containing protein [Clostridia bacterium]
MKTVTKRIFLALIACLTGILCLLGAACGEKDEFVFKKQPPEKVEIFTEVVMNQYFKRDFDASYSLKYTYYDTTLEAKQTVEQDSLVVPCDFYGDYTITVYRTKGKQKAELTCTIEVVPATPAMTSASTLEFKVGSTKSYSAIYRQSGIVTTPFETEEQVKFTSVTIRQETVDLKNASTVSETHEIADGAVAGGGSYTFEKQGVYEFTVEASNSEGTAKQVVSVVCMDEEKIPEGITATKAFFGEGNDTVMLLKSTNIEDMAFFSFDQTYTYDESNVRVEFLGDDAPQVVIAADSQSGNMKSGEGYLSTLEQSRENYQVHGPNRLNSRLIATPLISLSALKTDGYYVLDFYFHTFQETTDATAGYRVVTTTLYEKDEDGNMIELGKYNSRWNFDTDEKHESLQEGYILFVGSTRKDITFKYYQPSKIALGTPTLINVGSTVTWTDTTASVGQQTGKVVKYDATGYQVRVDGGEWADKTTEQKEYTVVDGTPEGKYELEVRAVYTIDGETYYGASSYSLIYHDVLNLNPFRLNVKGNTVSWSPRKGYCDTAYQYKIAGGEWTETTETFVTLKGYEKEYQSVTVRGVYRDGDQTTYTEEATVAVEYNLYKATESSGSVTFSSKTRADMAYVAYDAGTLAAPTNTHVKISFTGRNMPTVLFFNNLVSPDTTIRSSGAYISHDMTAYGYVVFVAKSSMSVYDAGMDTLSLSENGKHLMYAGIYEKEGLYYIYNYVFLVKGDNYTSLLGNSVSRGYTAAEIGVSDTDDLYTVLYGNAHYANLTFEVELFDEMPTEVNEFGKKPVFTFDEYEKTVAWTAIEGVESYRVTVTKTEGEETVEVLSETTSETSFDLSALAGGYYEVTVTSVLSKNYSSASTTGEVLLGADPAAIELSWQGNAVTWKDRTLVKKYEVYVNGEFVTELADGTERYVFADAKVGETLSVAVLAIYDEQYSEVTVSAKEAKEFVYGDVTFARVNASGGKATGVEYVEFDGFDGDTWLMLQFTGKNAPNFAFNATSGLSTWNAESYATAGFFVTNASENSGDAMQVWNSLAASGRWRNYAGSVGNGPGINNFDDETEYVMIVGYTRNSNGFGLTYYIFTVAEDGTLTKVAEFTEANIAVGGTVMNATKGTKAVIYPNVKQGGEQIAFRFATPATSLKDLVLGLDEETFGYRTGLMAALNVKETAPLSYISATSKTMKKVSPVKGVAENVDYLEFDGFTGASWLVLQFTGKSLPNFAFNATQAYSTWNNEGFATAGILATFSNEQNWGMLKVTNSLNTSVTAGLWKGVTGNATTPIGLGYLDDQTNYIAIFGFDKDGGDNAKDNFYFYLYSIDEEGNLVERYGGKIVENIALPSAGGSKTVIYPHIANGASEISFYYTQPTATKAAAIESVADTCTYKAQLKALHTVA